MRLSLIVYFALFVSVAFPQQTTTQPAKVTKVVRVRYGVAQKIADLLVPGTPVTITADNYLKIVVLKGDPDRVASLEQTIREIDIPGVMPTPYKSKDFELVIFVVVGSDTAEFSSGSQPPEVIVPVVKQLRAAFPYKNYQLLSSMLLRSSEGTRAESRGVLAGFESHSLPSEYVVEYGEAGVSTEDSKPAIHLRNFKFETRVTVQITTVPNTTQLQTIPVNIGTDVDLREEQKVVVGKANVGSSNLALFVVLTAKLVD